MGQKKILKRAAKRFSLQNKELDTRDLEAVRARHTQKAQRVLSSNAPLFKIDETPSSRAVKPSAPAGPSDYHHRAVSKLTRKLSRGQVAPPVPAPAGFFEADDLWANESEGPGRTNRRGDLAVVRAVPAPSSGQSLNPSTFAHQAQMAAFVAEAVPGPRESPAEVAGRTRRAAERRKALQREIKAKRAAKKLAPADKEARSLKEVRKAERLAETLPQLIENIRNRQANREKKLEAKKAKKAEEDEKVRQGLIARPPSFSKHRLERPLNGFVRAEALPSKLGHVEGSLNDGLRDRFASVYRRGLMEFTNAAKPFKTKVKIENKRGAQDIPDFNYAK